MKDGVVIINTARGALIEDVYKRQRIYCPQDGISGML